MAQNLQGFRRTQEPRKDLNELSPSSSFLASEDSRFAALPRQRCILADSSPTLVWSAGPDKLRDYFNGSWLDYRGRTLQQEIGQGWFEGVHPEDREICHAHDSRSSHRQGFQIEYRLQRHDGVFHWILDTAAPWFWPKDVFRGYVGSCIDIHQRRLSEENLRDANAVLTRQNKELSEFAYGASHDLQEPLRTLANYTQLLVRGCQGDSAGQSAEILPTILGSVQKMQILIRDLLNYSHIIHRSELRLIEMDSNMVVDQVLLGCQAAIEESGATITHDALPTVRADEAQLAQLLQNLISNAIKYKRPDKRPRVHISTAVRPEEWLFQVTDNGIGFDPQYSERIFGLFKRLHGPDEYSGSGIGLAICRKIVERHGGRIWAESESGGSRFFFTLRR